MLLQSSKTLAPSNIFQAFRKREAWSSNCQPSDKCTWLVIVRPRKIRVSSCRKLNPKLSAVASKKNSSRQTAAWLRSRSAARLSCQSKKGRVPRTENSVLSEHLAVIPTPALPARVRGESIKDIDIASAIVVRFESNQTEDAKMW